MRKALTKPKRPKLRPGDYFCVRTPSPVSDAIIAMERRLSWDNEAEYNHAGIVVAADGTTFESLKKVAHYGIDGYRGCPTLIARHRRMTQKAFEKGYGEVRKWDQKAYPWWRLALHAVGLARWIHPIGIPVCSELVGEHAYHAGLSKCDGYGKTPDNLADLWRDSRQYTVLYEGVW